MSKVIRTIESTVDVLRLERSHPALRNLRSASIAGQHRWERDFKQYITQTSVPEMAMSLELSGVVDALVRLLEPSRIADLGSGFSSVVVRSSASEITGATVWSVDDSPDWLSKSREALAARDLDTTRLADWDDFRGTAERRGFDLILHDLGTIDTRRKTVADVLDLAAPGGFIVFDDAHQLGSSLRRQLRRAGFDDYNLRRLTHDSFGRYARVARAGSS